MIIRSGYFLLASLKRRLYLSLHHHWLGFKFRRPQRGIVGIVCWLMSYQSHSRLLWWCSNYFASALSFEAQLLAGIIVHQPRCRKCVEGVYFFLCCVVGISRWRLMCRVVRVGKGWLILISFLGSCRFCFLGTYFLDCRGWELNWFNRALGGRIRSFLMMNIWEGLGFSCV